jgi:hypothetical protein
MDTIKNFCLTDDDFWYILKIVEKATIIGGNYAGNQIL